MLSRSGKELLFSSDRAGGAGGHDLYTARRSGKGFLPARPLPGPLNTAAHEFDATFLDERTIDVRVVGIVEQRQRHDRMARRLQRLRPGQVGVRGVRSALGEPRCSSRGNEAAPPAIQNM